MLGDSEEGRTNFKNPYLDVLKDCFVASGRTGASVSSSGHCKVVSLLESVGEEGSGG